MDKMKLAHEYAIAIYNKEKITDIFMLTELAWKYADAMLSELEKREGKILPAALDQFEADWSQAPDWAKWWAVDEDLKSAYWYKEKPVLEGSRWYFLDGIEDECLEAPPFNYKGNWKNSLRARP